MDAELTDHLGYERGDPAGRVLANSRNGSTPKTLATEVGDVPITTPRDRAGTFEPLLIPKHKKSMSGGSRASTRTSSREREIALCAGDDDA